MVKSRSNYFSKRTVFVVGQLIPLIGVYLFHWDFLSLAVVFYLDILFDFLFRYFEFRGSGQNYTLWNELRYPKGKSDSLVKKYREELVTGYTASFLMVQTIFTFLMVIVISVGVTTEERDPYFVLHADEIIFWTIAGILAMLAFRITGIIIHSKNSEKVKQNLETLTEIDIRKFFMIWITIIFGMGIAGALDAMFQWRFHFGLYIFTFGFTIIKLYAGLKNFDPKEEETSLIEV